MSTFISRNYAIVESLMDADEIHRRFRASPAGRVTLFILSAIILLAEAFAVWLLLDDNAGAALLVHILCCVAAVVYTLAMIRTGKGARFGIMFCIFLPLMGPFAAAGMMITLAVFKVSKAYATSFNEWYYSIFPDYKKMLPQEIAEALEFGRDKSWMNYSIIPFIDVVKRGSEAQKREAIIKMSQYFHPDFGPVLKSALQEDTSNLVRVQAATAMTKIKNLFFAQLMRLEKLRKKYPDRPEVPLAIASVYDDLAYAHILEPEQEAEALAIARRFYEEYLVLRPQDKRVHYLMGRLLMRQRKEAEAVRWFEDAITSETVKLDIWVMYAECLFRLKRYADLRRQARNYVDLVLQAKRYPDAICESIMLWSGRKERATA